jgi:hypothetical protein
VIETNRGAGDVLHHGGIEFVHVVGLRAALGNREPRGRDAQAIG